MKNQLESYKRPLRFCTLAGVEAVRLKGGQTITGRWWSTPRFNTCVDNSVISDKFSSDLPLNLVEQFANWPRDPHAVFEFTERYGPLTLRAEGGKRFSCSVTEWISCQEKFRRQWEQLILKPIKAIRTIIFAKLDVEEGEGMSFINYDMRYQTSTLYRLLLMELHSIRRRCLRKCARPDCGHPYFLSTDRRQRYCSEDCYAWGQRLWKREWWRTTGDVIRRQKAAKAGKDKRRGRNGIGKRRSRGRMQ